MRALIFALSLWAAPLQAQDRAGEFDYFVMALSWSANWCAREGDARNSPQCDPENDFGWILHGLWPQYESGYPEYCRTSAAPPSRADTAAMADIMGTSGLAWHQWRKHGVCSGLSSEAYFDLSRQAYSVVNRPEVLRRLSGEVTLPASLIEDAFLHDNPMLSANQITITCREGYIQEARICLTRELDFRDCGADVRRDCALSDATFLPMR
ncbi:ribonuclease T2 family protein [Yoonia litorea]|uniref:Ribonuclease T2 n=1 Tax=Yoonia litorea TaxID=1123755 RepID=A0A1I6LB56_9RHOB|nr:ribonuclease T2 [Yoonia litorea]SFS00706.1 ribonuclease T2 [Yoonia litorea]